jgi:hypothetical protein
MKVKSKNVKSIDLQDWDKLVQETYGRPYSFQQQYGCQDRGAFYITIPIKIAEDFENDTISENINDPTMGVSFNAWLNRDPKKPIPTQKYAFELELWWKRNFYPHIEMIANDLYNKGLIEAGDYVINIDW